MKKDYFGIELSKSIHLALPLENMGTVIQITPENICLIPGVSNYLLGVTNYQGALLWVLDTDQFFQIDSDLLNRKENLTAIIVKSSVSGKTKKVALVVKKIEGVLNIKTQSDNIASNYFASQFKHCLDKVVKKDNTVFGILNTETIFKTINK
ncbi:chemotaxis protein CheW [Cyanothece sp. BG0011]|uniref:chemotaxis protein CheW n=1 Tax=Cyanothece sp. BG0011 TaxID=2082950 RepID=UPI000D1E3E7D|nr:chemotaxis protein CheW [Cyanothece sp. BG0011]